MNEQIFKKHIEQILDLHEKNDLQYVEAFDDVFSKESSNELLLQFFENYPRSQGQIQRRECIKKVTHVVFDAKRIRPLWLSFLKKVLETEKTTRQTLYFIFNQTRQRIISVGNKLENIEVFVDSDLLYFDPDKKELEGHREFIIGFFDALFREMEVTRYEVGFNARKTNVPKSPVVDIKCDEMMIKVASHDWPRGSFTETFELFLGQKSVEKENLLLNFREKFKNTKFSSFSVGEVIGITRTCCGLYKLYEDIRFLDLSKFIICMGVGSKNKIKPALIRVVCDHLEMELMYNEPARDNFLEYVDEMYNVYDYEDGVKNVDFASHVWNLYLLCMWARGTFRGGSARKTLTKYVLFLLKLNKRLNQVYEMENYLNPLINVSFIEKVFVVASRRLHFMQELVVEIIFEDWIRNYYASYDITNYSSIEDGERLQTAVDILVSKVFIEYSHCRIAMIGHLLECVQISFLEEIPRKRERKIRYLKLLDRVCSIHFSDVEMKKETNEGMLELKNIPWDIQFKGMCRVQSLEITRISIDVCFIRIFRFHEPFRCFVYSNLKESTHSIDRGFQKGMIRLFAKILEIDPKKTASSKFEHIPTEEKLKFLDKILKLYFFKLDVYSMRVLYDNLRECIIQHQPILDNCQRLVDLRLSTLLPNRMKPPRPIQYFFDDIEKGYEKEPLDSFLQLLYNLNGMKDKCVIHMMVDQLVDLEFLKQNVFVLNHVRVRVLFYLKILSVLCNIMFLENRLDTSMNLFLTLSFLEQSNFKTVLNKKLEKCLWTYFDRDSMMYNFNRLVGGFTEVFMELKFSGEKDFRKFSLPACVTILEIISKSISDCDTIFTLKEQFLFAKKVFVLMLSLLKFPSLVALDEKYSKFFETNKEQFCDQLMKALSDCSEDNAEHVYVAGYDAFLLRLFTTMVMFLERLICDRKKHQKFFRVNITNYFGGVSVAVLLAYIIRKDYLCRDENTVNNLVSLMSVLCDGRKEETSCKVLLQTLCKREYKPSALQSMIKFILMKCNFKLSLKFAKNFMKCSPKNEEKMEESDEENEEMKEKLEILCSSKNSYQVLFATVGNCLKKRMLSKEDSLLNSQALDNFSRVSKLVNTMIYRVDDVDRISFEGFEYILHSICDTGKEWVKSKRNMKKNKKNLKKLKSILKKFVFLKSNSTHKRFPSLLKKATKLEEKIVSFIEESSDEEENEESKENRKRKSVDNYEIISSIRKKRKMVRSRNLYVDRMLAHNERQEDEEIDKEDAFEDLEDWLLDEDEEVNIDFTSLLPPRLRSDPELMREILGDDYEEQNDYDEIIPYDE